MCQFCTQHGEGKKWYLQAKNYSDDLLSDNKRRQAVLKMAQGAPEDLAKFMQGLDTQMDRLNRMPYLLRKAIAWKAQRTMKAVHYGQVLPIEDVERVFGIVNSITRFACICRKGVTGKEYRYCYGVSLDPEISPLERALADAGLAVPDLGGEEQLSREEALESFRRHEKESLCHTVWTMGTPFIMSVCNCDRTECAAMRSNVDHGLPSMFRAEYVAEIDAEKCSGCRACMRACQFGAIKYSAAIGKATIDLRRCYGCGICRAFCQHDAIRLEDRARTPVASRLW